MVEIIRSKTQSVIGPRKTDEFGLEFYRDGVPEVHEFKAYPAMDAGSLNYTLSGSHRPERVIEGMVRSIRKMLADDDGTPVGYRPKPYVAPKAQPQPEDFEQDSEHDDHAHAAATAAEEPELELTEFDADTLFVGPDGEPHDAEFIRKATEFEAGSSRRRFAYLMDIDEELTLLPDQLQTVYQRLLGKAANRPTLR